MALMKEFKEFAMKGNVMDLAIGVIIGAAFGAIITSLVADVLMPPLGWLTGGLDFKDKVIVLQEAGPIDPASNVPAKPRVVISYGKFINATINFLIVAIAIFSVVKLINSMRRKEAAAPSAPPAPTREEVLLAEIRDAILAKR